MHISRYLPGALLLALGLWLAGTASAGGIKCWTNKDGVRECGNVVPPEYAQGGHEALGRHGIVVDETGRAPTEEEIEEQRRLEALEAERQAEEQRLAQEQAARDRVLLDTFSSEDDIAMARDGRIATLDSQIRLTESRIEKLQENLDAIISTAAEQERSGREPPPELQQDIESVRAQIKKNEDFIAEKRREQEQIRIRFDADVVRFRELRARQ